MPTRLLNDPERRLNVVTKPEVRRPFVCAFEALSCVVGNGLKIFRRATAYASSIASDFASKAPILRKVPVGLETTFLAPSAPARAPRPRARPPLELLPHRACASLQNRSAFLEGQQAPRRLIFEHGPLRRRAGLWRLALFARKTAACPNKEPSSKGCAAAALSRSRGRPLHALPAVGCRAHHAWCRGAASLRRSLVGLVVGGWVSPSFCGRSLPLCCMALESAASDRGEAPGDAWWIQRSARAAVLASSRVAKDTLVPLFA